MTVPIEAVLYATINCKATRADTGIVVLSEIEAGELLAGPILRDVLNA